MPTCQADPRRTENAEALLLIDELDAAPASRHDHDDLALFRGVKRAIPAQDWSTVSHRPLKEVFPYTGLVRPGTTSLQPLTIGMLNDADSRRLLAHPWAPDAPQFDAATTAQLLKLAGGHPFKLHRGGSTGTKRDDPTYDWRGRVSPGSGASAVSEPATLPPPRPGAEAEPAAAAVVAAGLPAAAVLGVLLPAGDTVVCGAVRQAGVSAARGKTSCLAGSAG